MSLSPTRRTTTQVRTSSVPGLGHRSLQSLLDPLDIPRQVVVLPPLLTRKVGTLSLFCDVWRRMRCSEWVCNVLEAHRSPVTDTVHATNNVVEVVCDTTSPGCYSHLFLEIPDFMMESAESIPQSLPRDAWVTSIDLVDTYFHITIHRGYQKCLRFQTRDTIYQFWALPFGLSPAPWVFSKIMTDQML